MIIKICGLNITRDVQLCIDLGINLLGFVFYKKSKEYKFGGCKNSQV